MKRFLILFIGFVIALFASISAPTFVVSADDGVIAVGELTVHFIDVGQGDACIVELPDGRKMLIDAGENRVAVRNKLDEYIATNIKDSEGNVIEYFDYVIMTHSDSDHIGSMAYILGKYDAKILYRPNHECVYDKAEEGHDPAHSGETERNRFWGTIEDGKNTVTYHNALQKAYEVADEVIVTNPHDDSQNKITSTNENEYEINFYSPISSSYSNKNDYSPIMVIEYQGKKIVLSGDAEAKNEEEFVEAAKQGEGKYAVFNDDFCADVIKLGHHGSRTSSSEDYLNIMTKSSRRAGVFVIISCGEGNSYKHPHIEVLERLSKLGFSDDNILRTDILGDIVTTVKSVDGEYKVMCGEKTGGATPSNDSDILSQILAIFNGLNRYVQIVIIVAIVIIVILIIAVMIKQKGKGRKRR